MNDKNDHLKVQGQIWEEIFFREECSPYKRDDALVIVYDVGFISLNQVELFGLYNAEDRTYEFSQKKSLLIQFMCI